MDPTLSMTLFFSKGHTSILTMLLVTGERGRGGGKGGVIVGVVVWVLDMCFGGRGGIGMLM